jgi:glycosyltransferase 2 family protein
LPTDEAANPIPKDQMAFAGIGSSSLRRRPLRNAITAAAAILIALSIGFAVVGVLAERPHAHLRFLPGWLALSILCIFAGVLIQAELWRRLVVAMGSCLEPRRGLAIWCLSMLARYAPTSVLMPVVRIGMSRAQKVPASVCAASLVYEVVLTVCGAVWVASYFLIGLPALHHATWRWGVLLLPLAFMLTLHPSGVRFVSHRLSRRLGQEPLLVHLSLKRLSAFAAGYVAYFLLLGASLMALVISCHPLALADMPVVVGAMAIGWLAAAAGFILPGGLGAREAALVGALSLVMPAFVAITVAVASRLIQIAVELLLALVASWLALRRESRQVSLG